MFRKTHAPEVHLGIAALMDALDVIGDTDRDDHSMAKIVCENELCLRELLLYAAQRLAE